LYSSCCKHMIFKSTRILSILFYNPKSQIALISLLIINININFFCLKQMSVHYDYIIQYHLRVNVKNILTDLSSKFIHFLYKHRSKVMLYTKMETSKNSSLMLAFLLTFFIISSGYKIILYFYSIFHHSIPWSKYFYNYCNFSLN